MFTVYIIYSHSFDKTYVGFTSNLEQRMLSHNSLSKKGYTLRYRPWVVMHQEVFSTKKEALQREKMLKTGKGRELINKIKNDFLK